MLQMATKLKPDLRVPACVHWWILPPAAGPTSLGVCKLCGEERPFRNYATEYTVLGSLPKRQAGDGVPSSWEYQKRGRNLGHDA